MSELKKRKTMRLQGANYNCSGAYFFTLCTLGKKCILSTITETSIPNTPKLELSKYGIIAEKYIQQLSNFYNNVTVENYVIMPNHIHLLLVITNDTLEPVSTAQNSITAQFFSTFKRFFNQEAKENIWQSRSHDHIIRHQIDYDNHIKYIEENPLYWKQDPLYNSVPKGAPLP